MARAASKETVMRLAPFGARLDAWVAEARAEAVAEAAEALARAVAAWAPARAVVADAAGAETVVAKVGVAVAAVAESAAAAEMATGTAAVSAAVSEMEETGSGKLVVAMAMALAPGAVMAWVVTEEEAALETGAEAAGKAAVEVAEAAEKVAVASEGEKKEAEAGCVACWLVQWEGMRVAVVREVMASVASVVEAREVVVMAEAGVEARSGEEAVARAGVAAVAEGEVDWAEAAEGATEVEAERSVVAPWAVAATEVGERGEALRVATAREEATREGVVVVGGHAERAEVSAVASGLRCHRHSTARHAVHPSCRSAPHRIYLPIGQACRCQHRTPPMTTRMPRPARSQSRARREARPMRKAGCRTLRNGSTPRPRWLMARSRPGRWRNGRRRRWTRLCSSHSVQVNCRPSLIAWARQAEAQAVEAAAGADAWARAAEALAGASVAAH